MIETQPGIRQVTVAEAAVLLNVSTDTIKRRLRRGALQGSRSAQGRVLVSLPEEAPAPHAVQEPAPAPHAAVQVQCTAPEQMAAVLAERDWLRERVERAESEREQLRILLGTAQQSLLRALQAAPQTAPESPGASNLTRSSSEAATGASPAMWRPLALGTVAVLLLVVVLLGWR